MAVDAFEAVLKPPQAGRRVPRSLLPGNRHAALQEAREALDLQAEIEALDRAISDEESLADRPKGAA